MWAALRKIRGACQPPLHPLSKGRAGAAGKCLTCMSDTALPPPVWLTLPDGQEVRARLHVRRWTPAGWRYQVAVPLWSVTADQYVEPVDYTVWVPAGGDEYVRPIDGQDYGAVPIEQRPRPTPTSRRPHPGSSSDGRGRSSAPLRRAARCCRSTAASGRQPKGWSSPSTMRSPPTRDPVHGHAGSAPPPRSSTACSGCRPGWSRTERARTGPVRRWEKRAQSSMEGPKCVQYGQVRSVSGWSLL